MIDQDEALFNFAKIGKRKNTRTLQPTCPLLLTRQPWRLAWWGRTCGGFSFPPSSALRLLLVAVHINQWGVVDNHEGALDYMRAQAPVGARDLKTLEKLLERKVPTYFSACLTLTWDPNIRLMAPGPKTDVLVIDTVAYSRATLANLVPKEIIGSYKSYSVNLGYVNNQGVHTRPSFHHPLQFAYGNLLQLAKAKLVITARIHIALPFCLSFNPCTKDPRI